MSNKELTVTDDLKPILGILKPEDAQAVVELKEELTDSWTKRQVFRTETEMRISVLNDSKFPTVASKYWQSIKEQSSMFESLMDLSFELRKNKIKRLRLEKQLQSTTDELDIMDIQVDLDRNLYSRAIMEQSASDRVRELKLWSKLKTELDDKSFDSQDVNNHQMESLKLALENRVRSLNPNSPSSEVINATGPLKTLNKIVNQKQLNENN
jgi:hypothetical protein